MMTNHIYAIGAALVDTEVSVSNTFLHNQAIEKGIMTLVDQSRQAEVLTALNNQQAKLQRQSGGSACNSVVAASHLGAKACFGGKVADDADGVLFAHDLAQANVTFYSAKANLGVTGKCLVMITDDAERTMNTYLGVSDSFSVDEIDHNALVSSEWFYIEGYLQTDDRRTNVVKAAVDNAKQHGVKVAISLSDPFVAQIFSNNLHRIIGEGVDLIFCNKDEALAFTNTDSTEAAAEKLKAYTKTFAITDGANGALVFDGQVLFKVPAEKAKAIDTNGAGDMFAGTFLYAITAGKDYQWAAQLANKAAAMVVERFGPRLEAADFKKLKAS
ncbi:MAG: adenosine kinase [Porticoccaceae bacterium]|nr:adenosine kinase [Porticoccaceae bacterium]